MTAYRARPIKRHRATNAEMEQRRQAIIDMVAETRPTSVRHVYYEAITRGLIAKDSGGSRSNYGKVQRAVLDLRRSGRIPYSHIVDSTRWMRKPSSWSSIERYLQSVRDGYRRNFWADQPIKLEVWCESESIAGVLAGVTFEWDVPLFPCHGYSSETFAWGAAENWLGDDRDPIVLYVGDLDKHGKQIEADLRNKLEGFYGYEIEWTRVGITKEQIEEHDLGALATKPGHWEAEALPPEIMRADLNLAIDAYVPDNAFAAHEVAQESEQEIVENIVDTARGVA
jgi:hypothetical protein